jgi:hypothetical protein
MSGRYGGYTGGKKRILTDFTTLKSESALQADAAVVANNFDYTSGKGIWSLRSTNQFPKAVNRPIDSSGLTPELFTIKGQSNAWTQRTINISRYANKTARAVFRYINKNESEVADLQLDLVVLSGTTYSFENVGESFETTTTNITNYSSATWAAVSVATTNSRWNVDTGGTPTTNAARTDAAGGTYYVYAETTGTTTTNDYNFWLRSPAIALGASPTFTFYEARAGASTGELYVYLDITG